MPFTCMQRHSALGAREFNFGMSGFNSGVFRANPPRFDHACLSSLGFDPAIYRLRKSKT